MKVSRHVTLSEKFIFRIELLDCMPPNINAHNVEIRYSDGVEAAFKVKPRESILSGALEADVQIMNQCRSGSCGSCLAVLTSGVADPSKLEAGCLFESELLEGKRLLCSTTAGSDCSFTVDYASAMGSTSPGAANTFVDGIEFVSEDVVKLSLELADGEWLDFTSGQYFRLGIPGTDTFRSYSMSSHTTDLPKLEFLIRIIPGGVFSDYLTHAAGVDDVLPVQGPYGSFFWREELRRKKHILIAGGTGLAPMISMLDSIRLAAGKKPDVLLCFGCASEQSLFAEDVLALRGAWMSNLETRITLDRAGNAWSGIVGNPLDALSDGDVSNDAVAYLCGPPGLVNFAKQELEKYGLSEDSIFAERFLAD